MASAVIDSHVLIAARIASDQNHDAATETLDALVRAAEFDLYRTTKTDFDTGRSLFQTRGTDDFDAVPGITRLATPENPFV
jgi:hypothetical protein